MEDNIEEEKSFHIQFQAEESKDKTKKFIIQPGFADYTSTFVSQETENSFTERSSNFSDNFKSYQGRISSIGSRMPKNYPDKSSGICCNGCIIN
jgi:hypothetical protein